MIVPIILIIVVLALAIFVTNANQTIVQFIVFGYSIENTLGLLIMGALGIGIVLGMLSMLPAVLKHSFASFRQGEELAQMKQKDSSKKP